MDLAGYVELQQCIKAVVNAHRLTLKSTRQFWKELLAHHVGFPALVRAMKEIETTEQRTERSYKTALERYPRNVKLLKLYASFLEVVKNDPRGANHYYAEAERLEEIQSELQREKLNVMTGRSDMDGTGCVVTSCYLFLLYHKFTWDCILLFIYLIYAHVHVYIQSGRLPRGHRD